VTTAGGEVVSRYVASSYVFSLWCQVFDGFSICSMFIRSFRVNPFNVQGESRQTGMYRMSPGNWNMHSESRGTGMCMMSHGKLECTW
jgi:hypothetical protein